MQNVMRKKRLNPAIQIIISFAVVILIGAVLLCLPIASKTGTWQNFLDSLFTSTSSVCVTGLVVVDTAVYYSVFGQIVIMLLIQIGGLGFITLTSLLFMMIGKKFSYKDRLTLQESLNKNESQGVVKLIKKILILVFAVEFFGFLCLAPSMISKFGFGGGCFRALFLSISAFCNAGFDIIGTSSMQFSSLAPFAQSALVLLPIMFLVIVGGLGYIVIFDICGKVFKKSKISFHSKLVIGITLVLIFVPAILFLILEWNNPATIGDMGVWDKIINSLFQSISPRTAGFATYDLGALTPASKVLVDFLMFVGGSPMSTAGGIKTTTLFILIVSIFKQSNSKGEVVIFKKQVKNKVIRKCIRVVVLYTSLLIVGTFLIAIFEPHIPVDSILFEVLSALSTVGLTIGITPIISPIPKIILMLCMFIGRVGILTITIAIAGRKRNINDEIEYPNSKVIVGW